MEQINFVAIDFETANNKPPRFICQIGIAVVNNDYEIIERKSIYVQPPNNIIEPSLIQIHGISPQQTKNAKNFKEIWEEIKDLFQYKIVAHKAYNFDLPVLMQNLEYYKLDLPFISKTDCTFKIFNQGLEVLCAGFGIDYTNHHDAGFDAECCAKFYINHLKGIKPDETLMKDVKPKDKQSFFNKENKLSGDILQKDLTNADPNNPFYDKKVVITGNFSIKREPLAIKLKAMGADIDTGISKRTNFVLVGKKAGPAKLEKIKSLQDEGINIRIIHEEELSEILAKEDFSNNL